MGRRDGAGCLNSFLGVGILEFIDNRSWRLLKTGATLDIECIGSILTKFDIHFQGLGIVLV